jgi:glycosyltransferase involved in cell wall biosynthesis
VTRDAGSTTDIVTDGQNAVVLNPGEAQDVARTVVRLLKDSSERELLGQAAYERAMEDFQTWDERIAMEIEEIKRLVTVK